MRTLLSWLSLGTLVLAGLPAPAGAQRVGEEFQVNTYTTGWQALRGDRAVAADASGNFVVVWYSFSGQDGNRSGVFGQRYDSGGMALGSEFQINSFTTGDQADPSVASDASGNFVVVWEGLGQSDPSGGIFGQRYDSAGGTLGGEFRVNSSTPDSQESPSIVSDASGNFVVVWHSTSQEEILGQRYDSGGRARGSEFQIGSSGSRYAGRPSVASDASGNFVVVWEFDTGYFGDTSIYGRRFDSEGTALGDPFRVTPGGQYEASVASDVSGNFVVVWRSADGDSTGIFGKRYDSAGGALGNEFRINSFTPDSQREASVASHANGNFVVAWASIGPDGDTFGVVGQRYDSDGVAQGGEFQINSYTTDEQRLPSVAATGTSEFVVAWESYEQVHVRDVFGQRFEFGGDSITVVSPNTNVKWRIGSLQRIQWTHNLGAGATFRIELDRDDDGTFEELIAAAAPVDNAAKGSFAWTVTGPRSGTARVRVAWTDDLSVSDASDVTFQIRPVGLD